jgi:hypothetical protein
VPTPTRWPCLFPQHGPGRKHERPIALTALAAGDGRRSPVTLIRGLSHSDGCRALNREVVGGRAYSYPRYFFSKEYADAHVGPKR